MAEKTEKTVSVEKLRSLTEHIVTAETDEALNKLIDKEEVAMATVAKRLRAVERTALPTFARVDHKLSENPVYDAFKAANGAANVGRNLYDGYKLVKMGIDWFRT